ncbi:unnamed protein product [Rhizophagus irregularis]|nr:unnamed protein product [Rhizophagus irregularis]
MKTDSGLELGNEDRFRPGTWKWRPVNSGLELGNKDRKKFNYQPIRIAELRVTNRNSAPKSAILRILEIICRPILNLDERRLNSLFWMFPDQVNAYGRYHDIVIIDTTSKTNQFNMLLMLIIVVDNNFKSLIVAAAALEDETEATFSWVLQELKNSCDVTPTALYSDADPALITAVKKNYSVTRHFHCIFHIDLNLRKKLKGKLHDQFELFRAKFLAMRNSLCHKKFEIEWKALTDEFPACEQYLTRVLYPWIQSTQRVEVMNKIIKDKLNRSSCLADVVREVQKTFDQQSKKAILSECKNEIPTKGIPSIMDEYFPELDKILREYLTPQILQKQRDQMAQSLCYDTILIDDWLPLLDCKSLELKAKLGKFYSRI